MRASVPFLTAALALVAALPVGVRPAVAGEAPPTRESALALAFPAADEVVPRDVILTRADAEHVRTLAGAEPGSRLVTIHEARRDGATIGWAMFDTHVVRTSPETLLLVLDATGQVSATHLVAFHEPPEYGPTRRWLHRFVGRALDEKLAVGRGVDGITGATLTAHAATASVRRMLATWQVAIGTDAS